MCNAFVERRFNQLGNTFLEVSEGAGARRRCRSTSGALSICGPRPLKLTEAIQLYPALNPRPQRPVATPKPVGAAPAEPLLPSPEPRRNVKAAVVALLASPHGDMVTTVMVRNLRPQLRQYQLLNELDKTGFAGRYDFVYMPCSFKSGMGKGFAFINLINPAAADDFICSWDRTRRLGLNETDQPLTTSPADVQGAEAYIAKCRSGRIRRITNPDYRPISMDELRLRPAWKAVETCALTDK